jgi:hypothetical protein
MVYYVISHITGFDLGRRLLKMRNAIPIIHCKGYHDDFSPDKARKVGIREILLKPQGNSELDRAIRGVLNARAG